MVSSYSISLLLLICVIGSSSAGLIDYPNFDKLLNAVSEDQKRSESLTTLEEAWKSFKSQYNKTYASAEEEIRRKLIFAEGLKQIERHNFLKSVGLKSFTVGINEFADWTREEYLNFATGCEDSEPTTDDDQAVTYFSPPNGVTLPATVDWRTKGYVTPLKYQGNCGACYSFSATGAMEGQHFRKTGKLVSLSEQNIIDCSTSFGNNGCHGGSFIRAFRYVKANGGIDSEEQYPYEMEEGLPCRYNASAKAATVSGYVTIPEGDEAKLKEAVATIGPVSTSIDASHESFKKYTGGVYVEPECTQKVNHGVLIVGYGTLDGQDYWLIKNSWKETWGINGYAMMARNRNSQCGIALRATYPLV
jgi:cathepsin L